jgi:hypothetical protein
LRLQYLGDSKDSFKWDYHDYLATELNYRWLNVALMLTPDDDGTHGKTAPDWFPARAPILQLCRDLRRSRDIEQIKALPQRTGSSYRVSLHKDDRRFLNRDRTDYFSNFDSGRDQLVFLDPDNGFEPQKSCDDRHVAYGDVVRLLDQLSATSVVSVFQNHRRISFQQDFARIRARLGNGCHSTAVHWHSLMFVAVGRSETTVAAVFHANERYAKDSPVNVIG